MRPKYSLGLQIALISRSYLHALGPKDIYVYSTALTTVSASPPRPSQAHPGMDNEETLMGIRNQEPQEYGRNTMIGTTSGPRQVDRIPLHSSIPQVAFKRTQVQSTIVQKALDRGVLAGASSVPNPSPVAMASRPQPHSWLDTIF